MDEILDSAWKQLKNREITCEEALQLLVDDEGTIQMDYLDEDLANRFFRDVTAEGGEPLPPVIPLLLWRACYYLACPKELSEEEIKALADRAHTDVQLIPISAQAYRTWFRRQNQVAGSIDGSAKYDPITGQLEENDISEVADYLSQVQSQEHRINAIVSGALQSRASDIHLEPTQEGLRVRYRIDGIMRNITTLAPEFSRSVVVAIKVMADMDIAESRCPQDGRIGRNYSTGEDVFMDLDLRVSTLPCVGGEKVVIRLLKRQKNAYGDIGGIGFVPRGFEMYHDWIHQPQGLIIITGPTGSGKTSTLYTTLKNVASEHVNVITVEDPVEYVFPMFTQTQVNEKAGMTFASGLRAILRQDPDIIMVGEIRDQQTIETVIRAALTGHLVFTTMHTNDAISTIPRIKDLGPDPGLVSDALLGILAQRLVRRICPNCAQPYEPAPEEFLALGLEPGQVPSNTWMRGEGCAKCFNSGYQGRSAVIELLHCDRKVKQLIYEGTITQLQEHAYNSSCLVSFRESAIDKVLQGITTVEEVQRVLPSNALNPEFLHNQDTMVFMGGIAPEPEIEVSIPVMMPLTEESAVARQDSGRPGFNRDMPLPPEPISPQINGGAKLTDLDPSVPLNLPQRLVAKEVAAKESGRPEVVTVYDAGGTHLDSKATTLDAGTHLDPKATVMDGSMRPALDPKATVMDGSMRPAVDPKATVMDGSMRPAVDPKATVMDGSMRPAVDPKATVMDGSMRPPVDPKATVMDGSMHPPESAPFAPPRNQEYRNESLPRRRPRKAFDPTTVMDGPRPSFPHPTEFIVGDPDTPPVKVFDITHLEGEEVDPFQPTRLEFD